MEYWVDAYNLILRDGAANSLADERVRLLRAAVALAGPVRLYFDAARFPPGAGVGGNESRGAVRVVYVKHGTADDRLIADLRGYDRARDVTVVTDDRELRRRAKQMRATTLGVAKFKERLDRAEHPASTPKPDATPRGNLSRREVDEWLDYFGVDEDWKPESE